MKVNNMNKQLLITTGITISLVLIVAYNVINYFSLPEVHTNSYGDCIRVINHSDTKYDCENMPDKFINYVVQI
jgi:hypothetical protein